MRWPWSRKSRENDLERELRSDLEAEAAELQEDGLSPEEARHAARRAFGNATLLKEDVRAMWGWGRLDTLSQDLRYGLRQLGRNPGFTAVAVLTLALGIGANTAIFSVVYSVLLRPLPFHQPDRLVQLFETEVAPGNYPLSGADYLDWQRETRTLQSTSVFSWTQNMNAGGTAEPEAAAVTNTQANFFDALGVHPAAGRSFAAGEDAAGKNKIAILSYGFWQSHFGGARNAIGKKVTLNAEPYTVVGIMPEWFNYPAGTDLWTPLDMSPEKLGSRGSHNWRALARLKDGVTLEQARADMLGISKRLEKQFPNSNNNVHAVLTPLREPLVGDTQKPLWILLGAVALLLLIACANVANLLLARATTRQREMALRASLGAGRLRLIRQLLTESMLLAFGGATLGTLAAWWCVAALQAAKSLPIPRANPIELDGSVLAFTIALSVFTGLLFGLAPALQAAKRNPGAELKDAAQSVVAPGGARRTLRDALVIGEIAITLALLVGAGLLLRSFTHLRGADLGIDASNVLTMTLNLPDAKYETMAARRAFVDQLVSRAARTPGVEAAAYSLEIPLEGGTNGYLTIDGSNNPALSKQLVGWNFITPDYFRVLRIPLVKGRNFTDADVDLTAKTSDTLSELYKAAKGMQPKIPKDLTLVSIVSQSMARTFWPNQDPVGKTFRWNDAQVRVVGVVGDVREYGIRDKGIPQAYYPLPLLLSWGGYGRLTVKTRVPPLTLVGAMKNNVRDLDSNLAVFRARSMEQVIAADIRDATVQTFLLAAFAVVALALAMVGLYGVMSYLVTQRRREIGIRMALGARQIEVLRLILKQGAKLTLSGLLLGAVAAFALTRLLSSRLYGVGATDPLTFGSVFVLLAVVALAAYYLPARRASRMDPSQALRHE